MDNEDTPSENEIKRELTPENIQTPKQESTPPAAPPPSRTGWKRLFSGTSIYGFELVMATFGLTVAAIVIDYGFFAFFNYLKGIGSTAGSAIVGEFSLWIVAAMLVWVPIALTFYFRTRGQLATNPIQRQTALHKVFISIYMFVNILIGAGALFAVLYTLIRLAVGVEDMHADEVLVRIALPALLTVGLHGAMLFAYSNAKQVSRKRFGVAFAAVAGVVMVALLISSVSALRAAAIDDKRESDLQAIQQAVSEYNSDKAALPDSLDDLEIDTDDLKLSVDDYSYDKVDGDRYELCATFATDTDSYSGSSVEDTTYDSGISKDEYTTYASFSSHDKGKVCFNLRVYTYNYNNPLDATR